MTLEQSPPKATPFDAAIFLDSEEMIAEYINAAMETNNTDVLLDALADVAKARGMAKLAEDTGLSRESLYKTLRFGAKPRFETVWRIMQGLGVQLDAKPQVASQV